MNSPLWGVHPATLVKMARRRYTKRRYYKKGRYSANISEINGTSVTAASGKWSGTTVLTTNPAQSNATVSQTYTVKNFEVNFTVTIPTSSNIEYLENIVCYIMYVPQGMNVSEEYNLQHPEYVMTYKYVGSPMQDGTSQQFQPIKIRSRMARRLQTGDSIILFISGYNQAVGELNLELNGLVRWWTKAN